MVKIFWVPVKGRVVDGLGEGARYVELYSEQIRRILGMDPYPGTLNLVVDRFVAEKLFDPRNKVYVIPPPRPGLGEVYAWPAFVRTEPCLAIKPRITRHGIEIIEIVSSRHLRSWLGLSNDSIVEVLVGVPTP